MSPDLHNNLTVYHVTCYNNFDMYTPSLFVIGLFFGWYAYFTKTTYRPNSKVLHVFCVHAPAVVLLAAASLILLTAGFYIQGPADPMKLLFQLLDPAWHKAYLPQKIIAAVSGAVVGFIVLTNKVQIR